MERGNAFGFNEAVVLKDAELAGKLKGLEDVINIWLESSSREWKGKEELINAIRSHILGTKEEE